MSRSTKKTNGNRHNLTFDPVAKQRGEELARADRRSFSAEMNWLIDAEWQRRESAKTTEQKEAA